MTASKFLSIVSANGYSLIIGQHEKTKNAEDYKIMKLNPSNRIVYGEVNPRKWNSYYINRSLPTGLKRAIVKFANTPCWLRFDHNMKHILFG